MTRSATAAPFCQAEPVGMLWMNAMQIAQPVILNAQLNWRWNYTREVNA